MASVLVAIPQENELQPFLRALAENGHPAEPLTVGRMACFAIPSLGIVSTIGGHGKTQFAIQTQYLIGQSESFRDVLCVGAAGCLEEQCRFGDVVVATITIEHDYKIRFVKADSPSHSADPTLLEEFQQVVKSNPFPFTTHFGPVASGDEDIVDGQRALELQQATDALCVAWEGSGGARAAAFNGLRFLEIRCITDGADSDAASSFHANCEKAMPNIAQLIARWRSADKQPR